MPEKPVHESPEKAFSPSLDSGLAYRTGIEFISGILAGLLMGYGVDAVFHTQPWGMVVMVILGSAAGMLTVFRRVGGSGKKGVSSPSSALSSSRSQQEH